MAVDGPSDGPGRAPAWLRAAGFVLMLPLGLIIVAVLFFLFGFDRVQHPGAWLIILVVVFAVLFFARMMVRRTRRQYRRQRRADQDPAMQTLRERYARGEITKEQFEEMARELRPRR